MGKFLADIIKWIHFIIMGIGIAMLPIAVLWPASRVALAYSAGALLVVWVVLRECPLRTIEHRLRLRFHPEGAHGDGFVYHHVLKPLGVPRHVSTQLTFAYVISVVVIALIA